METPGAMMLDAALSYARRGWSVFPCRAGGKEPSTPNGHTDATTDEATIRAWWSTVPSANIGISLEPSGLVVLDVDVAEGKPGAASLVEFDVALPPTLVQRTGRGGLHAVFARGDAEARRLIGFRPGLDLLGKGYIVAAPSVLTDGGTYAWVDPVAPLAPLPAILRDAARPRAAVAPVDGAGAPIAEGGRNIALFRLGAALRDQGLGTAALALALERENAERCRPPLPEDELVAVLHSVLARVRPSRDAATGAQHAADLVAMVRGVEAPTHDLEADAPAPVGDLPPLLGAAALTAGPPVRTYPTGWTALDALLGGGIKTRQLLVLTAPPGDGKSALALVLAGRLSPAVPVLYISTELEGAELAARGAAPVLGRPWTELVASDSSKAIAGALDGSRVYAVGCDALPMDTDAALAAIIGWAQAIAREAGAPPVIVIDYLQDMARGGDDARSKVGQLAAQARVIAQGLDCAVVAVSSVSRAYYGTAKVAAMREGDDARVYLATAKESGDVDYAAATVVFLDVAKVAADGQRPARVAVAKCRHGHAGIVGMRFDGRLGMWVADPGAVAEVLASGEGESTARTAELTALAVQKAREMEARGEYPSRKVLEDAMGLNRTIAVRIVGGAISTGVLVQEPVLHTPTHKMTRYAVVRARKIDPSSDRS